MVAVSDDGESAACLPLAVVDVVMRTYAQSQAWYARAGVIPGRSSTRSKAPGRFYDVGAGPLYAASGDGAILTCVDGHDYIDMLCALGAISLGYRSIPSRVVGGVYSLPLAVEAEAAEMVLQHVAPRASQVRFTKTGSEACHAAYRIAKAATGRDIVLVGDWAYHGWYEWCATPKGAGVVTYPHGFDLNDVLHQDQTAAVFIEPHRWESVNIEWLKSVRAFCDRIGALLVFDSMIYGGRWALGGASAYFGVQPDLECFGKALGNGEAVACVVGGEILEQHGQVASGTFSGDATGLQALCDTVQVYTTEPVIDTLWARGRQLWAGLSEVVQASVYHDTAHVDGNPVHLRLRFDDATLGRVFAAEMVQRAVLWHPDCVNVSYAHSEGQIDAVIRTASESLKAMGERIQGSVRSTS